LRASGGPRARDRCRLGGVHPEEDGFGSLTIVPVRRQRQLPHRLVQRRPLGRRSGEIRELPVAVARQIDQRHRERLDFRIPDEHVRPDTHLDPNQ
jgi:hypothetical protein